MLTRDHLHDLAVMARQSLAGIPTNALPGCVQAIIAAETQRDEMDRAAREPKAAPDVVEVKSAE